MVILQKTGGVGGGARVDVNKELKVFLKEH